VALLLRCVRGSDVTTLGVQLHREEPIMADSAQPRAWRSSRGPYAEVGARSHQRTALLVAGVMLALAGALAGLLFYLREAPRPSFVAIVIDQYRATDRYGDLRFPVSAWSAQDRAALGMLGWQGYGAFNSQSRGLLVQELTHLGQGRPAGQPLVIYLCAYAAVREDGVLCLLPADAQLDDGATWLPLREVFALLKQCPVQRKLLLLDVMKPLTDARAGLLSADVATPLQPVVEAALEADKQLQVFCACSPGQVSLSSEELGHSAFVYYLLEGLAGQADGTKPDGVVSVQELAAHVTRQVQHWAWHTQGTWQTPALYGSAVDYPLNLAEKNRSLPSAPLAKDVPEALVKGWEQRDRWRDDRIRPVAADLLRQLEAVLLRTEQRWRGGVEVREVQAALKERLQHLDRLRQRQAGTHEAGVPRSLAEEVWFGARPPAQGFAEARRQLKELAQLFQQVQGPKPNDKDVAKLAADTEQARKKYLDQPFELAWTVFRVAVEEDAPTQAALRCWYGLMQSPPARVEVRFLQRLVEELKAEKPEDWPGEAVAAALRVTDLAEQVDVRKASVQAWIAALDAEAASNRRTGVALLFARDAAARARAAGLLREALRTYETLHHYLETLLQAQRTLRQAMVELPGSAGYLEHNPGQKAAWLAAVKEAQALQALLAQPAPAGSLDEVVRRVGERAAVVRNGLDTLRQPHEPATFRRLIAQRRKARPDDFKEIAALLLDPRLGARDRLELWKGYRTIAETLHDELPAPGTTSALPGFEVSKVGQQELEKALLRAEVSAALLRLYGASETAKVEAALQQVAQTPTTRSAWYELRRQLRETWNRHEIEQARRDLK
jgi:hypothetical protein